MEDKQAPDPNNGSSNHAPERSETVRSRWTPKPEQILILESIFNSGMVNPPKDETVRIRKLLEKFGSVGDANVFYWFQNRRSRSRRRQRQLQASLIAGDQQRDHQQPLAGGAIHLYEGGGSSSTTPPAAAAAGFALNSHPNFVVSPSSYLVGSSSSSCGAVGHDHDHGVETMFSRSMSMSMSSTQMGFQEMERGSILCPSETSTLHYHQTGFITVFINGIPTEVPRGPLDAKAMFGQDVMLLHSSGVPVPLNEFGFLIQSLQQGESYFL
ncbi:hypothetical protein Tsubulata_019018, partial [Turnera subulata]